MIGVLLILFFGAASVWFVLDGFRESVYCQRGTWDFRVGITEPVIARFPTPSATSEEFHWGCGDGPKPPDQTITFDSRLPVSNVLALAQRHIASNGFHQTVNRESPGLTFTNGQRWLYLSVTPKDDGGTHVIVSVLF